MKWDLHRHCRTALSPSADCITRMGEGACCGGLVVWVGMGIVAVRGETLLLLRRFVPVHHREREEGKHGALRPLDRCRDRLAPPQPGWLLWGGLSEGGSGLGCEEGHGGVDGAFEVRLNV